MMTTEQLERAVRQMRTARHQGKISSAVQRRVMRRLAPREAELHWQHMMALRGAIAKEIEPVLKAKRQAESDMFGINYAAQVEKIKGFIPKRQKDPTLTREWWEAAGERDHAREMALKKAIRAQGKVQGWSKEQIKENILVALGEDV